MNLLLLALLLAREPTIKEKAHEMAVVGAASTSRPEYDRFIADMLDEMALGIASVDRSELSPLIVDRVSVSPELSREVREQLAMWVSQRLHKIPKLEEVACMGCDDVMRSRMV